MLLQSSPRKKKVLKMVIKWDLTHESGVMTPPLRFPTNALRRRVFFPTNTYSLCLKHLNLLQLSFVVVVDG